MNKHIGKVMHIICTSICINAINIDSDNVQEWSFLNIFLPKVES